jgi:hypothetical protein
MSPISWEDLVNEEERVGGDASLAGPFPFHEREDAPRSQQWQVTPYRLSPPNRGKV